VQVWLVSFGLLFASIELIQWIRHVVLPLPVAIAAGSVLALASNAESLPRKWLLPGRSSADAAERLPGEGRS